MFQRQGHMSVPGDISILCCSGLQPVTSGFTITGLTLCVKFALFQLRASLTLPADIPISLSHPELHFYRFCHL